MQIKEKFSLIYIRDILDILVDVTTQPHLTLCAKQVFYLY